MNIIKDLHEAFGNFLFFEQGHFYVDIKNPEQKYLSVTSFIPFFHEKFDANFQAPKTAKKLKMTTQQVLKMWDDKREFSCEHGSKFHSYIEGRISRKVFDYHVPKLVEQVESFIIDQTLIPVASEFVLASEEHGLAGSIDQLYMDYSCVLDVYDWKTNEDLLKPAYKNKKMFYPFNNIPDNKIGHYTVQLNIYQYLLMLKGFKVNNRKVVWFYENNMNYEIIEIPECLEEVEKALKLYKEKPNIFVKE